MLLSVAPSPLEQAEQRYIHYAFNDAARLYAQAIASGDLHDRPTLTHAWLYLAFSRFIAQPDKTSARAALRGLFELEPNYVLNEPGLHPELVKFFAQEKAAFAEQAKNTPPPVTQPPPPPPPPSYRPAPWFVRVLPLGIGQFAGRDPLGGTAFLLSEVTLVALNVVGAVQAGGLRSGDSKVDAAHFNSAVAWWSVQTVAGGVLIATCVLGAIDGLLWSPARGAARATNAVTPLVFAKGAGVGWSGEF